jgi:transcriptional regulator with XRE-family HTH domain
MITSSHSENAALQLRKARQAAGLSLRELAVRVGTSHSTLLAYETSKKMPAITTFCRILEAAGFAVDFSVTKRIREQNGIHRGEELAAVLKFAEQFPAKADRHMAFPTQSEEHAMDLVTKIISLHQTLASAKIPHAFGGALALAWCTERARGTIDIDVNILIPAADFSMLFAALPADIAVTKQDCAILQRDGQVRLWWNNTPLNVFLNNTPFHEAIAQRIRWEQFGGAVVPFLACQDIAFFKAFFNRTKDWADLEEMKSAGTLNVPIVIALLVEYFGANDERIVKLQKL